MLNIHSTMLLRHIPSLRLLLLLPLLVWCISSEAIYNPQAEVSLKSGNKRHLGRLSLLIPFLQSESHLLYGVMIGLHDSKSNKEGNFGLGFRSLQGGYIVGGYGFYDIRSTRHKNLVHQLTLGAELLSESFEFRGNVYLPQDTSFGLESKQGFSEPTFISGTKVVIKEGSSQRVEQPLSD